MGERIALRVENKQMRHRVYLVLLTVIMLLIAAAPAVASSQSPQAVNGRLDLGGWNPITDGPVNLDGQWDFYWHQLLGPQGAPFEAKTGTISVPGTWRKYTANGETLSGYGFATYRLRVKLRDRQGLALHIPFMSTAYRLWIDGEPVAENGVVGRTANEMVPEFRPVIVSLPPGGPEMEIVVQVSNFHHKRGGIWSSLEIGESAQLQGERTSGLAIQIAIFGGLIVTALYHLGLYIFRQQDRWLLFSGLFNLMMAIRMSVMGQHFLAWIFPGFDWELSLKLEYGSLFIGIPMAALFIYSCYPEAYSRRFVHGIGYIGAIFTVVTLFSKATVTSELIYYFEVMTAAVIIYGLYGLVVAAVRNRPGARLFLGGMLALGLTGIHDILYHNRLLGRTDLAPVGLVILTLVQSLFLSQRLSSLQRQASRDGLTGLYNYDYFYDRLTQEVARARRDDAAMALLQRADAALYQAKVVPGSVVLSG